MRIWRLFGTLTFRIRSKLQKTRLKALPILTPTPNHLRMLCIFDRRRIMYFDAWNPNYNFVWPIQHKILSKLRKTGKNDWKSWKISYAFRCAEHKSEITLAQTLIKLSKLQNMAKNHEIIKVIYYVFRCVEFESEVDL